MIANTPPQVLASYYIATNLKTHSIFPMSSQTIDIFRILPDTMCEYNSQDSMCIV